MSPGSPVHTERLGVAADVLTHVSHYLGPGCRQAYWNGECELVPAHFSEVPRLLREHTRHTLMLAAASLPDEHGYFSLGTNADFGLQVGVGRIPNPLPATLADHHDRLTFDARRAGVLH
jgi:acyl-CoA hydrolase